MVSTQAPNQHQTFDQHIKKTNIKDTLLTPRFQTTDFDALGLLDISEKEEEFKAVLNEFSVDYNLKHFVRNDHFEGSFELLEDEDRELLVAFLERSCMSEYSGFLLYKEASLKLRDKNPILAECFNYLGRDEARHAGFINRTMSDSHISLDLPKLTKNRNYTFIKPKFLFYATYLSEKIGYWKYILMHDHFESNPQFVKHPIFRYFKNWCQDENRHGDFMGIVLRSQPHWLDGFVSRYQIRLFLLLFVLTTYFSGQKGSKFYEMLGIDVGEYDLEVLKKTNEDASKVFPIYLDIGHPKFVDLLDSCVENNEKLSSKKSFLAKLPFYILNAYCILQMYFIPVKKSFSSGTIR